MNNWKYFFAFFGFVFVAATAYTIGIKSGHESAAKSGTDKPQNLEEVREIESKFDQQQVNITNRIADIQNKIETVKLNLDLDDTDSRLQSNEIADRLAELDEERFNTQTLGVKSDVPIPADSPDGQLLNQPRTASGISRKVLQNYEQETGVSPQEIEELMRRTE